MKQRRCVPVPVPRESHTTNRRAQGDLPISGTLLPETMAQLAIASLPTHLPYQHQVGLPEASLLHGRTHWFREANYSHLHFWSIPSHSVNQSSTCACVQAVSKGSVTLRAYEARRALERWCSGYEHLLLLQETERRFPVPTWCLITIYFRGSDTHFQLPLALNAQLTGRKYTHKIKIN